MKQYHIERFMSKVDVKGPDECWEWQAYQDRHGYGHTQYENKLQYAHRVSYKIHCGEIPKDMNVLHECDNPACVNPKHLFLGTQADNIDDMINKGRNSAPPPQIGVNHWASKLTEEDVREIKTLIDKGWSAGDIADHFNVAKPTIKDIKAGRTWRHVA